MRRATITLPDDLEAEVEAYLAEQEAPPSFTALVQAALRRFLGERRFHRKDGTPRAESDRSGPESSEIAEEPAVYEIGRARRWTVPVGVGPWNQVGLACPRLEDLPALLASLPCLSEAGAEELAEDLDRAREELARTELTDPWARIPAGEGSAGRRS